MPHIERTAAIVWEGNVARGGGTISAATSGAFSDLGFSLPTRVGQAEGKTSPEELIAGAHGVCYAMVVNATIGRMGGKIEKTHVTCTVTADLSEAGIKITKSHLDLVVEGLTGVDAATLWRRYIQLTESE